MGPQCHCQVAKVVVLMQGWAHVCTVQRAPCQLGAFLAPGPKMRCTVITHPRSSSLELARCREKVQWPRKWRAWLGRAVFKIKRQKPRARARERVGASQGPTPSYWLTASRYRPRKCSTPIRHPPPCARPRGTEETGSQAQRPPKQPAPDPTGLCQSTPERGPRRPHRVSSRRSAALGRHLKHGAPHHKPRPQKRATGRRVADDLVSETPFAGQSRK